MNLPRLVTSAARSTADVVRRVDAAQLSDPTPCAAWDVRTLAEHMTGFLGMSEHAARKAPVPSGAPATGLPGDWADSYAEQAENLADAWSAPGALDGTTQFGPGEFPAEVAAAVTLMELTVHGWDLARATGQALAVDPAVGEAALGVVRSMADQARAAGSFAGPVEVGEDATAFDRALAECGRDPGWTR